MGILLIGSGWRAEYFLRVARLLPEHFNINAVVTTNKERAALYAQWGFACHGSVDDALGEGLPDYAIVSVAAGYAPGVVISLLRRGIHVLAETPAAPSLEALREIYPYTKGAAKYQTAEQYHLRPDHSARLAVIRSGRIGRPVQSVISLTNTYHAMSLLRKYLSEPGVNAVIRAQKFLIPGMPGHGRNGPPTSDAPEVFPQILASLEFDSSVGIYDFEEGQHRSYIRTQRILIKGDRGVIDDKRVKYLPDCKTAMESEITRHDRGHDENCEGVGLKGFTACGEWVYTPRFTNARLNDDEIAAAECMARMNEYINGASPFYSFAEAAQDAYLGMLITRASESGEVVKAEAQPWAENLKIHNDMREINPPN